MVWGSESRTVGTSEEISEEAEEEGAVPCKREEVELPLKPNAKDGKPVVQVMGDANWADDAIGRKSTSGGVLHFHGCAIVAWSRRQSCAALSSAESELNALGSGAVEALGFAAVLEEWGETTVPVLYSDSSSALCVDKRGPGRMKHIALRMLAL